MLMIDIAQFRVEKNHFFEFYFFDQNWFKFGKIFFEF